ncbi:YceK/YidQ family lipoprotein [Pseudomonas protegens]|uniref:YceK/YidQ family lipoprotein n=1 Tax=Pseudomonas protegens TaxID=380021 RepID=UPI0039F72649
MGLIWLSQSGCASSLGHLHDPCPYTGVQLDLKSWDVVGPLMIIDLPFSAVMDTVLLPFDLIDARSCNW